jgi:hypothetical protein
MIADNVDEDWLAYQAGVIEGAAEMHGAGSCIATICLSSDCMKDDRAIELVVEKSRHWPASGYYVIAESPSAYLVEEPDWLANLLILSSGLALQMKPVIVGYTNHQQLCLACAGIGTIASGTWLNVRSFPIDKFYISEEDEVSRRAKGGWYYCPVALSEYKMPFLDIANKKGVLAHMLSNSEACQRYAGPLFSGAVPSSVNWGERNAFRHYLTCLNHQVSQAQAGSFKATIKRHEKLLDEADDLLRTLRGNGIRGQDRDFYQLSDTNRTAIQLLSEARRGRLRRNWKMLVT